MASESHLSKCSEEAFPLNLPWRILCKRSRKRLSATALRGSATYLILRSKTRELEANYDNDKRTYFWGHRGSYFEINIPAEKNQRKIIHWSSFPSIEFLGLPLTPLELNKKREGSLHEREINQTVPPSGNIQRFAAKVDRAWVKVRDLIICERSHLLGPIFAGINCEDPWVQPGNDGSIY